MQRVNSFLTHIHEMGCDCAIVTDRANVRYLSGFTGSTGYLIISSDEKLLVTDFRYIQQAAEQAKGFEIVDSATFKAAQYAKKFTYTAFEDEAVSYKQYLNIKKNFKRLEPMGGIIINMRSVKDEEEIKRIRTAEKIADDAFAHVLSFMKAGMTELQVAREIEFYMLSHGAEALSFETIVAAGDRGSMPHATPSSNVLKDGDLVVMDFGCVYEGYCSDMTRTVGIGSVSEEFCEAYHTVLEAQLKSLAKIKAGVNCAEVHNIAFDIIDGKYKGMFGHALGHGVGLEIHEQPTFSKRSDYPLPQNAVITVEPGVYIPGKCGVRIEDLVLATADGYENMTSSPKELILI